MIALHRPERVLSLLNPELPFPQLGPEYHGRHLQLRFHDILVPCENQVMPSAEHVRDLLQFVEAWDCKAPLLVHCRAGISRSTAAAYVAACCRNPHLDEREIAAALRRASPLARPNGTLVRLADQELGRQGRMSEAIESTGRDLPWIEIDEADPFSMLLTQP